MEHIAAWLLDRLQENFRVVKEAPEAIVLIAIVIGIIVYLVVDKLHSERFAVLADRIGSLNEQISDYRSKLQGATPDEAAHAIADLRRQLDQTQKCLAELSTVVAPPQMSSMQGKLLFMIAKYQKEYSETKLVINRGQGSLFFDNDQNKGKDVSIIKDLYNTSDPINQKNFEQLMETMPLYYLRFLPEMRLDSPFVISVTEAGFEWLKNNQP
jgi:hypothetical protein